MSELIQKTDNRTTIRWKLLTGVSMLALALSASEMQSAHAEDADRPVVWIEAGGQLERLGGGLERLSPPFISQINTSVLTSPLVAEKQPLNAISSEGKIQFQPDGSDWVFSAAIRYGRSASHNSMHQETQPKSAYNFASIPVFHIHNGKYVAPDAKQFVDARSQQSEKHAVLDFQVGKDVGLGLFQDASSTIGAGIRVAQFSSKAASALAADPDFRFSYRYYTHLPPPFPPFPANIKAVDQNWHDYASKAEIRHSFRGIGPSFAWEGSVPFAGNKETSQLTLDWGINAAMLFGRQRVRGHHDTQAIGKNGYNLYQSTIPYPHHYYNITRSKSVSVPNVGGFAGLSFRYPNAKISIGYRADFFFGAIDGGVDVHKSENRAFYGPYASISIGLGD